MLQGSPRACGEPVSAGSGNRAVKAAELRDNRLRNLVLHSEDIIEGALVALRPDVVAGRRVDELRGDAYPLAAACRLPSRT